MSILVFADAPKGKIAKAAYEAVYYGKQIADKSSSTVTVLTYGDVSDSDLAALGNYGATKVLVNKNIKEDNDEQLTAMGAAAVEKEGAKVIIFSFDPLGKSLAPRLSARLQAGLVTGATELPEMDGDNFTVTKSVFSGKAFSKNAIKTEIKIISLMPNSIKPVKGGETAQVESFTPDAAEGKIKVKEMKMDSGDGIPLPEADLVVSAGRGLKGPENWGIVEDLAKALGAATACSRPVADMDWRPHHEHVGQTGIAIRPNLYIAAGISGAIQHLAGVNNSQTIVVINTDPEAPFFKAADYGVVGDAFEVLPRLTAAVKKFKANN
ncbi:electron transfer flavoprotein subunit alpha/FixB family protein [Cryomorpha ignava]|uniref:Electron transfer flavoprotein subunit alpha/FixB family protein n=1 Tax=Cryomorpha ignava TaxID=101383 RepID=A0A7K3WT03_9FLAO|nr:electron transfer flavoprotein subunit alpha/FixB family protein [Cryomorpha ignava]NEN24002.1 electron transfer flavoprotein subunit alpha/FixB family protein [Cryomorpha ignava]